MKIVVLFWVFMTYFHAFGQVQFNGVVIEKSSKAHIELAEVLIVELEKKLVTNEYGEFSLNLGEAKNLTLVISSPGYVPGRFNVVVQDFEKTFIAPLQWETRLLSTVVITGTRDKKNLFEIPQRIDVVRSEVIDAMVGLSADNYLMSIPGAVTRRSASIFGAGFVSLRATGSEAGRTLVMVDGIPVNKFDGGTVNWNAIDQQQVKQIEVMKGPGSTIHGGNAMGGAINIISVLPTNRIEGNASHSFGTFSTNDTRARLGGRNNNFYWGANAFNRVSDGYVTSFADDITDFTVPAFLQESGFGGRAGYYPTPNQRIEVSGGFYTGKRGTGSNFKGHGMVNDNLASDDGAFNTYTNFNGRITYDATFDNRSQLKVALYSQRENFENIRESFRQNRITRFDVLSKRSDMGFLSSYSFNVGNAHRVVLGLDVRAGSVDGEDRYITSTDLVINRGKATSLGLFLQDEIRLNDGPISFLLGARFDVAKFHSAEFLVENPTSETAFLQNFVGSIDDATFSAFSPRVSVQYHKRGALRVYAGYSKGFRPAVLDDICRTGRIAGGMKIANPNLKPEYLDNFEVGADLFLSKNLHIAPSIFYSIGNDYHAYISTGDSIIINNRLRPILIKRNIGKVEIYGAEIGLNWDVAPNAQVKLSWGHSYSKILEFERLDANNETSLVGLELTTQPRNVFNALFSWRNKIVNSSINFHFKDSQWLDDENTQEIEGFYFVDFQLWRPIYRGLNISLMASNLLDNKYIDSRNMISPGRMISLKLGYSF